MIRDAEHGALSLIRGDPLIQLQQWLHLAPQDGLGVARRAAALALIAWLPLAVVALVEQRALQGSIDEPLLSHFGIHGRGLVAIPLLVLAEGTAHSVTMRLVPQFLRAELVQGAERTRLLQVLRDVAELRDRWLPWVVVLGLAVAVLAFGPGSAARHELRWAEQTPGYGFGSFWFNAVLRPIFLVLLLAWLWRLLLACVLTSRIARLDLALVPTHPDGAGGLGFLEALPLAFSPVVLALSVVLASRWAHDVMYHGVHITALRLPMLAFGVLVLVIFLAPLLPFFHPLAAARRRAELEYGALIARHGRLVRRRWIDQEPVEDDPILCAPELGPVADTITLYDATRKMRTLPIGRRTVLAILLPAALPLVLVLAIEVPVGDLLLRVAKALV